MKFIQTSVSTVIGPHSQNWQEALVTTVVGVTEDGELFTSSRMNNDPWSPWEEVGPDRHEQLST